MSDVPLEFGGGASSDQQAERLISTPAPEQSAAPAPADQSILRDIETASETIALYTAIIGKRPQIIDPSEDPGAEYAPPPILTISPNWPQVNRMMISVWFKRMSHHARRRLDQAITRLAS